MTTWYLTSDKPGSGTTSLALALAKRASGAGRSVTYKKLFKRSNEDCPDMIFAESLGLVDAKHHSNETLMLPTISEYSPGLTGTVCKTVQDISASCDLTFLDAPSLDEIPSNESSSIVSETGSMAILIFDYHSKIGEEYIVSKCAPFSEQLSGIIVNSVPKYRMRELMTNLNPLLEARGLRTLGIIPEDRIMLSPTVHQIAAHLGAQWHLCQERPDELVGDFLIGGNIMESPETYFGRTENKAVIVRGDRPDIQLAALTHTVKCLILTGGISPIEYVHYTAQQMQVPILVAKHDTVTTCDELSTITERSTIYHPEKIEQFVKLLDVHVDCSGF